MYGSQIETPIGDSDSDESYQQAFAPDLPIEDPIVFEPEGDGKYESYA
jgi:hypothetical protein